VDKNPRPAGGRVMKITHNVAFNFHPIFIPLNQLFGGILDFGFWIADLLYRFALSFFIKSIRLKLGHMAHVTTYYNI
jgi:hypothetical protein